MCVHTQVSSPHAEHSVIKGQQRLVEQSLVLNCLSEVGGFFTNVLWTACSAWVGTLLVLSEAVFFLHKLLAPDALPNALHKLQAGYLIWRGLVCLFVLSLVTAFGFSAWETTASLKCSACIAFKSQQRSFLCPGILTEGSCVFWTQAAGEVDPVWISRRLHFQKRRNLPLSSQVICTSEQESIFSSQQRQPQKNRSSIFGPQTNLFYSQQKLQEVFKMFCFVFHYLFLLNYFF